MCTREIEGEATEFGTSGYTMNDVFVLYDRATDSIWYPTSSTEFSAVSGTLHGESIEILDEPAPVALGEWLDVNPDALILLPTEEDLARQTEMRNRPFMGLHLDERDDGLFAGPVGDGGPAHTAGVRPGDRIKRLGQTDVSNMDDLRGVVSEHAIGDTLEIVVIRSGKELALTLTLGQRD